MVTIEVTEEFVALKWLRENNLVAVELRLMERLVGTNKDDSVIIDTSRFIYRAGSIKPQ